MSSHNLAKRKFLRTFPYYWHIYNLASDNAQQLKQTKNEYILESR